MILLDLMMPTMDGRTFVAEKARDPAIASIPVLLFSAVGDPKIAAEASA